MALYRYIKADPTPKTRRRKPGVALSFTMMALGAGILLWVAWPIISFTVFTAPRFWKIISPLPETVKQESFGSDILVPPVLAAGTQLSQTAGVDYTNANTWFPTSPQKKVVTPVNSYKLSIPKLTIHDATVLIAGDDLSKSLVHYGGTGLPGAYGNAVVFGHSVLPQFFNPKDYKAIFSTLPTLKNGDEIFVAYDGVTYRYVVYEMTVTDPTDLSMLEQRFDDSYLTLITCVPPGTYWKRLNVKARLMPL